MNLPSIHIAGGGFCGTMVLYHLTRRTDLPPLTIYIYDREGRFGRGIAYSTPRDEHLLNVPAMGMSAIPDAPEHFLNWLGPDAVRTEFYPRRQYGDYISSLLQDAVKTGKAHGHDIRLIAGDAPEMSDGAIHILATGTSQPMWPGGRRIEHPSMLPDPYLPDFKIGNTVKTVVILGTGLSAADALMTLFMNGYQGKIICISRNGLWPVAHGPKTRFWHWRKYIDALRPDSNHLWESIPPGIQKILLRKITYWNIVRHRMPPAIHQAFRSLRDRGQLETRRASILAIEPKGTCISVKTNRGIIDADLVINCLGYIPYSRVPATGFRLSETAWTLGAPLFGRLIETTAVPELRMQARNIADDVADYLLRHHSDAAAVGVPLGIHGTDRVVAAVGRPE